jgi:hypothetical protein
MERRGTRRLWDLREKMGEAMMRYTQKRRERSEKKIKTL